MKVCSTFKSILIKIDFLKKKTISKNSEKHCTMIDTSRISSILNGSDSMVNNFKENICPFLVDLDLSFKNEPTFIMIDMGDMEDRGNKNLLIIYFNYNSEIEVFLRKNRVNRMDLWQKFYGYDDVSEMVEDIVFLKNNPIMEESEEE